MEESEPSRIDGKIPVRKRSAVERAVVWGGILALIVVVLVEWTSRKNYDATLGSIVAALRTVDVAGVSEGIPVAEAERYVKGFAFRGEIKGKELRKITYRWASLFKFYKLAMTVDVADRVSLVDSVNPGEETK